MTKSASRGSPIVKRALKRKQLAAAKRRGGVAKNASSSPWTISRVNRAVAKDIKNAAAKGKNDAAFKLFVGSALNGETPRVTGWKRSVDA